MSVSTPFQPVSAIRLSDLICRQPISLQRHIHTAVIRAVGAGELRGVKLSDRIKLPHSHDKDRMIFKTDVVFTSDELPNVNKAIAQVIARYAEKSNTIGRNKISYNDFLKLSPDEIEVILKEQLEADKQMRSYGKKK